LYFKYSQTSIKFFHYSYTSNYILVFTIHVGILPTSTKTDYTSTSSDHAEQE